MIVQIRLKTTKAFDETKATTGVALEFNLNKPVETFSLKTPMEVDEKWVIAITSLKLHFSLYDIAKHQNRFPIPKPSFWEDSETIEN